MAEAASFDNNLRMASTTSTDNTGLLAYLASLFEKDTGVRIQWVATGTGRALELGRHCDVDVLLVHAPEAEKEFMDQGFGVDRKEVMFNDFILVGPADDPAGVRGLPILDAFKRVAEGRATFISRGDDSGTHKRELGLWAEGGVNPGNGWYMKADKGMRDTLEIAAERAAYALTDRGTFTSFEASGEAGLVPMSEGDPRLRNQYGIIAVNPDKCRHARYNLAKSLIDWLTSDKGQSAIADFRLQGRQLFTPNAAR